MFFIPVFENWFCLKQKSSNRSFKEGEDLHVEIEIEVDPKLTVAAADDIKDCLEGKIMAEKGVVDVVIEFDEEDDVLTWKSEKKIPHMDK